MTSLDDKLEKLAVETPKETGGVGMVLWQTALGLAILFVWQGVSGRLVDNFFISNPIDVGRRLIGWTLDGSIFVHLWATVYATSVGFALGAVVGAVLGIWLGIKLTGVGQTIVVKEVPVPAGGPFVADEKKREDLGITRREIEILELIAQGLSNREIAEKLFVSESTVRTHSSRIFDKLGARRRTQAVQLGKQFGRLP